MKRDEVFEVLEPPPHGLTRLDARLRERNSARLARRLALGLAMSAAAVVLTLLPRAEPELSQAARTLASVPGEAVVARGETVVQPMASSTGNVVLVRVSAIDRQRAP